METEGSLPRPQNPPLDHTQSQSNPVHKFPPHRKDSHNLMKLAYRPTVTRGQGRPLKKLLDKRGYAAQIRECLMMMMIIIIIIMVVSPTYHIATNNDHFLNTILRGILYEFCGFHGDVGIQYRDVWF
jgi:hypothetical protein